MKLLIIIFMPLSLSAYPYELMFKMFCHYKIIKDKEIHTIKKSCARSTPGVKNPERTDLFEDADNMRRRLDKMDKNIKRLQHINKKAKDESNEMIRTQNYILFLVKKVHERLGSWITKVD